MTPYYRHPSPVTATHLIRAFTALGVAILACTLCLSCTATGPTGRPTSASTAAGGVTVDNLRCEYLVNPLGIDAARPRLSWAMVAGQRGQKQTAYRVQVASSRENLLAGHSDLWDTGKIDSDQPPC